MYFVINLVSFIIFAEQSSNDVEKIETETLLEEEISCEVVSNEANDPATEFEKESASCEGISTGQ